MALQTVTLGDATTLTVPMRTAGAAFTPAAGYQLIFTAKLATSDLDAAAVIQKKSGGFGLTESTSSAVIALLPIDTSPLAGGVTLYCDIQAQSLTDAADIKTVAIFQLLTVRDVTRLTDTSITVYTSEPPGATITVDTTTNLNGFLAGDGANVQLATTAQKIALPISTATQTALDLKVDLASDSTITVKRGTTDILSAAALRTAYTAAKALTPGGNALSATNRAVVMIPAGRYDFGLGDVGDSNHGLELDAQFVDLVGATGVREEVVLTSAIAVASRGTVEQTADDVKISFLTMEITSASSAGGDATEASAYFPTTALANAALTDVICQSENPGGVDSMRTAIEYAGTYIRVTSGQNSFGSYGTASGTFTDCVGGNSSYGRGGPASGTFLRCVAGHESFGVYGTASGTFTDCAGGDYAFGGYGTVSGTFTDCVASGFGGFAPGSTVDAGAVFIRCHGAGTHMNVGTTRDCLDASNNRIDNTPPDAITATSAGVAASILTPTTEVTTNDDNDLDNVTLANGTSGQIKHIYCVASFAGDTWKITPATMLGGTQITFGDNSAGTGCTLVYADNEGWIIIGNNGGTIA